MVPEDTKPVLQMLTMHYGLPVTPDLEEFIDREFRREVVPRRTILFMNGETNTRHYFVEKGLLRLFLIDMAGKEFNLLFAYENQVIGDLATPAQSRFNLETIEDSIVHSASEETLSGLFRRLNQQDIAGSQDMFRRSYLFLQKRLVSILTRTAEENYRELLEKNPGLLRRLPQYHVASYLGVSPEFLSKIIARTSKK